MSNEVKWNRDIFEEFCSRAMLGEFETKVLEMHIKKESNTKIAYTMGVSERTIDRTIKILKDKYDNAQMGSMCMPKREKKSHLVPFGKNVGNLSI